MYTILHVLKQTLQASLLFLFKWESAYYSNKILTKIDGLLGLKLRWRNLPGLTNFPPGGTPELFPALEDF